MMQGLRKKRKLSSKAVAGGKRQSLNEDVNANDDEDNEDGNDDIAAAGYDDDDDDESLQSDKHHHQKISGNEERTFINEMVVDNSIVACDDSEDDDLDYFHNELDCNDVDDEVTVDSDVLPGIFVMRKTNFGPGNNIAYIQRSFEYTYNDMMAKALGLPNGLPRLSKIDAIVSPLFDKSKFFFRIFDAERFRRPPDSDPSKFIYVDSDLVRSCPFESAISSPSSACIRWIPCNTTNDGFLGYSLYNRIVRKYFRANKSTNGGWFWGKVKLYSPITKLYTVEYEDDDEEQLYESELLKILRGQRSIPTKK
jgi:hypothetical protein